MAVLIHDEPQWPMPSPLTREPSLRRLRVWEVNATLVAVITERGIGTSVTNAAREAYTAVHLRFPGARVFEHYPADVGVSDVEHFDEISFTPEGRMEWKPWPLAVIVEWLGPDALEQPGDSATGAPT